MNAPLEILPLAPTPAQWEKIEAAWAAFDLARNKAKSDPAAYQRKVDKLTSEEAALRMMGVAV